MIEKLYQYAEKHNVLVDECKLPNNKLKGLYCDNVIYLDERIETETERCCVLAEEIGHHVTSNGNILDCDNLHNLKQEIKARNWASDYLITLNKLIKAYNKGVRDKYELAEVLGVTDDFLTYSITHLKQIHGAMVRHGDYVIYLEPTLMIFKNID